MKRFLLVLPLLYLFSTTIVNAEPVADEAVEKILALSGLPEQMAELSGMVLNGIEQSEARAATIQENVLAALYRAIDDAYTAENILAPVKAELKKNLNKTDADVLLQWYESELGRAITQAEIDASSPAAYMEMTRQGNALFEDESRVILAQSIAGLTQAVDMVMELQTNTGTAIYAAITQGQNPDQTVDLDGFRASLESQEEIMRDNVEQFVVLTLLYTYREFSLDDQKTYLGHLDKEETRRFNQAVLSGLETGMSQSIIQMLDNVNRILRPQN